MRRLLPTAQARDGTARGMGKRSKSKGGGFQWITAPDCSAAGSGPVAEAHPGAASSVGGSRAAKKRAKRKGLPLPLPTAQPAAAKKPKSPLVEQVLPMLP